MSNSAQPGWYHAQGDPPGTERFWDGSAWTEGPRPIGGIPGGPADSPLTPPAQPQASDAAFGGALSGGLPGSDDTANLPGSGDLPGTGLPGSGDLPGSGLPASGGLPGSAGTGLPASGDLPGSAGTGLPGSNEPTSFGAPPAEAQGGFGTPPAQAPAGFGTPPGQAPGTPPAQTPGGFPGAPPAGVAGVGAFTESSKAVTALVLSILGIFCLITAPIGLIIGLQEKSAIDAGRRDPEKRGMAVAAIVIGGLITGFFVLAILGGVLAVALGG